jgi:hypothetical protein
MNYVSDYELEVGVTTVVYTVTDVNGLSATCSFDVWIKNLNAPNLTADCPPDVTVDAEDYICEATVTVPAPTINNPCGEAYTITNDSPYKTSDEDASGTYPVGSTTFTWTIIDASGNVTECEQTVTVADTQDPTILCPEDFSVQADPNQTYASNVDIPYPTDIGDNCEYTLTWILTGETTDASNNTEGESYVPTPYSQLNLGENIITYTIEDASGNTVICSFTITVLGIPEIVCPDEITETTDPGLCTKTLDPGIPSLTPTSAPASEWSWVMTGATTGNGSNSGSDTTPIGPFAFNVGETKITWTACNLTGCSSCEQIIIIEDNEPPTFTPPTAYENCVDPLHWATYDPANANPVVNHVDPNLNKYPVDFRTFESGNEALDIEDISDNCCNIDELIIHWKIEFSPTPDPQTEDEWITHDPIESTGQPSDYRDPDTDEPLDIYFWGDGVLFETITHTITYWLEDCSLDEENNGNMSEPVSVDIVITPRPQITKENY